jgi:hypothetical protein
MNSFFFLLNASNDCIEIFKSVKLVSLDILGLALDDLINDACSVFSLKLFPCLARQGNEYNSFFRSVNSLGY